MNRSNLFPAGIFLFQSPVRLQRTPSFSFLLLLQQLVLLQLYPSFQVSGSISNTGHSVIFTVDNDTHHHINVTGGPLSYKYQFQEIHIHYGLHDQFGSEHSINGYAFPAEVSRRKANFIFTDLYILYEMKFSQNFHDRNHLFSTRLAFKLFVP